MVDGYRDIGTVEYTVTEDSADPRHVQLDIRNSAGSLVLTRVDEIVADASSVGFGWDGRNQQRALVAAGVYSLAFTAIDSSDNRSETKTVSMTVSRKRLVTKTMWRTVRAAGSKVDQYVGRCSTLRRPSARGWVGSLGLYSNTRCGSNDERSLVATAHAVRVPKAFQNRYGSLVVKVYGGAARSRPNSRALLEYLRVSDKAWVKDQVIGPRVGTKTGQTAAAGRFVHAKTTEPWVAWGLLTARGHRYDVRDFTVVLRYTVLQ